MNNDFAALKTAMHEEKAGARIVWPMTKVFDIDLFLIAREDCSSVSTFKGVCSILEESRPLLFLLENVDGMETKSTKDSEEVPSAVPVGLTFNTDTETDLMLCIECAVFSVWPR